MNRSNLLRRDDDVAEEGKDEGQWVWPQVPDEVLSRRAKRGHLDRGSAASGSPGGDVRDRVGPEFKARPARRWITAAGT
jgi:hypothetical protein